jgi:hypothetical protein
MRRDLKQLDYVFLRYSILPRVSEVLQEDRKYFFRVGIKYLQKSSLMYTCYLLGQIPTTEGVSFPDNATVSIDV